MIYHFYMKEWKLKESEGLLLIYTKKWICYSNKNLKQALNHGLVLKKVHRIIKFHEKSLAKPYIDMNTELRKKIKNDFEKDFFKLLDNSVFGKTMENVQKPIWHVELWTEQITTEKKQQESYGYNKRWIRW